MPQIKTIGLFFCLVIQAFGINAQQSKYIIQFKDKVGSKHSLSIPSTFLSPESIDRKKKYKIAVDSSDLPVSQTYIDSILSSGKVTLVNSSKWLNQILIQSTDENAIQKIKQFPFVVKSSPVANRPNGSTSPAYKEELTQVTSGNYQQGSIGYGSSLNQIAIHQGDFLHAKGYWGQGVKIAVFDAGFYKYQNLTAFDSIRLKGKIPATFDIVDNTNSVNEDDAHGMYCLSIMAANIPGIYVGTAPQATYYLFEQKT